MVDSEFGVTFLSGPPGMIQSAHSVALFRPLMACKKRYILLVLDDDLASPGKSQEKDLFKLGANFSEKSRLRILDSWSMTVLDVPLPSPSKVRFVRGCGQSLNLLSTRNQMLMINISALNMNCHMKMSENLKMDSLSEQIRNIFEYCGRSFELSPVLELVAGILLRFQSVLGLRK